MTAQHLEALELANEIRLDRARVKREVKAGRSVAAIISEPPDCLERMPIAELLGAIPRFPRRKMERFLQESDLAENRIIGHITVRQRNFLAALVSQWETRPKRRARTKFERGVR